MKDYKKTAYERKEYMEDQWIDIDIQQMKVK